MSFCHQINDVRFMIWKGIIMLWPIHNSFDNDRLRWKDTCNSHVWHLDSDSDTSYPCVQAEQTDASCIDDVSDRVGAGPVQILLIFPRLDELPCGQVGFKGRPTHEMVLAPVSFMYPWASGCVCAVKQTGYVLFFGR